ncbi:MAG TPA: hypothetical protein DET40_23715 [Lentisphaeria bacterium]|nr:MAG: hypothetical protein A2X45_23930 [Lentisphaerae bacterium GWF2_50_93]HCE46565.1 hypothetical protein [Lentisphaeria bacterium]
MKCLLILLLALFSLLSFPLMAQYTTEDGNAARTLWLKGFDIYEKAETSEKNNDKKSALSFYQDSIAYFQKVKGQYPKWNSALVEYRLKICERKLQTLQAETSSGKPAVPGKGTASAADPEKELKQLKEKSNLQDRQIREIQNRLDLTLLSLNEARKEAALGSKSKEEIQSVMKEKNDLEKKCALLSDELKRVQDDRDKKSDDSKWNDKIDAERKISAKLKEDNAAISAKSDEFKAQYQKAASDKMELDFKMTKLADSQKAYEDKLAETVKLVDDLTAKLKTSEKNRTGLEVDLKDVQGKMEKQKEENDKLSRTLKELVDNPSSSDLAKQLQTDNEKLKKDLAALTTRMEQESLERNKLNEEKKEIQAKLEKVEGILIDTKNENTKYGSEVENLRKKAMETTSSSATYQKSIALLSEENKSLKAEVGSLAANIDKMTKKEKDLAELTRQCAILEDKNRKSIESGEAAAKENEKLKTALESSSRDFQAKIDKEKQEIVELNKKIKDLADNPASSQLAKQLQADNEKLKKEIELASSKMEKETADKAKLIGEMEAAKKKLADSETAISSFQKNVTQLSDDNKSIKSELDFAKAGIEKLSKKDKELSDISKQFADTQAKNTKLSEDFASLLKDNEKLKEQLADVEKMRKERLDQGRKIVSIQMTLDSQAKELAARTKEIESAKADIDAKANEIARNTGLSKKYQELQKTCEEFSLKNAELAKLNSELQKKQADLSNAGDSVAKTKDELEKKADALASEISKKNEIIARKEKEMQTALRNVSASSDKALDENKKLLLAKTEEALKLDKELKDVKAQIELTDKIRIDRDELKIKVSQKNAEIENLKKANELSKNDKTVTVERVVKEVVKEKAKAPNEEEIKLLLKSGEESEKKGNKEAAIWHYERVLSMDMENQAALTKLAFIYSDRGDDAMTLKYLERALCYEPYDVQKLLVAAFAYIRKGDYYLALGVLSRAAAMDPKNPELQRYLGVACSNLGWVEAADRQFRTAFELDPKSSETAFNLAVLLATSETPKMDEARKWYKKAKELGAETDPGMEKLFKE